MAPKNRRRGRGGKSERQSGEKEAAAKADPAKDPPAAATKPADDAPSPAELLPLKQLADVQNLSGNGPGSREPDVMSMQVECASTVAPSEIEEQDETNEAQIEALAEELPIAQGAAEDVVAEETAAVDVSELLSRADAALTSGREALASASPAPCDGRAPATDRLHWLLTRQHANPFEGQAFSPARVAEAAVDAAGPAAVPPITAEADVIASDETDAISAAEIVASLEARGAAAAAAVAEREEEITPERLAAAALGKLRPAAAQHVFDACSAAQARASLALFSIHSRCAARNSFACAVALILFSGRVPVPRPARAPGCFVFPAAVGRARRPRHTLV